MRMSASPEIKFQVRPDLHRDRVTVRMGALSFSLARREAVDLAQSIIAACEVLVIDRADQFLSGKGNQ